MMKKFSFIASFIIVLILMFLSTRKDLQTSLSLAMTVGVLMLLILSFFYFERSSLGTKEISLIATLSAFAAVSRIIFAPLPNIKPITFLVALSGYVFGPFQGFIIGSTSAFLSNIFFGQGPWTPWQMFSWGLIGLISGLLGKREVKYKAIGFSLLCFFFGFFFDWIMNLWNVISFVKPITIESVMGAYITGLTFDILHGTSSFIFSIIFYDNFYKVLKRYKRRLEITYLK